MTKDAKTEAALKAEQEASFQYQDDLFLFGITSRITQRSWDRWFALHTQVREQGQNKKQSTRKGKQSAVSSARSAGAGGKGGAGQQSVKPGKQTQPGAPPPHHAQHRRAPGTPATVPHKTKKSRQGKKQITRKKK